MKKISLILLFLCLMTNIALAGGELIVKPQPVKAGATYDDATTFCIELSNDVAYTAIQLDIYVPDGFVIDEIEFSEDRFPFTKDRRGNISWEHTAGIEKHPDFYRITFTSQSNSVFKGNSGPLCNVYYQTADDIAGPVIPVKISNAEMSDPALAAVTRPTETATFFYLEDTDWDKITAVDLTAVTGRTLQEMATAARMLMTNPNSLLYLNEGSEAEGLQNVVIGDVCASLSLTDGYAFNAPKAFTATSASYSRTLANDGWYSLCLPFAAGTPADVAVEKFVEVNAAGTVVTFESSKVDADVPRIFQGKAGTVTFSAYNTAVNATPAKLVDGAFEGTYIEMPQGTVTGSYALRTDGSGFGIADETAYVTPFRAIIHSESGARMLKIVHGDSTTRIDVIPTLPKGDGDMLRYNLSGGRVGDAYQGVVVEEGGKKILKLR